MTLFDYLCELYLKAGGDPENISAWRAEVTKGESK
jgi:hypothetical protein